MSNYTESNPRSADSSAEKPKRCYRDISQKYCSRIDDNVIIVREAGAKAGDYECLSSHLCGGNAQCAVNSATAANQKST